MKGATRYDTTHNPFNETHWVSCLRGNLTSSSSGEGLETGRATTQVPRQSFTRQLVFKRMKQLLHLNQVRRTHRDAVEATIRALLVAWALQEDLVADIRAHLATPPPVRPMVVSTWLLGGLGVETLRQQVHGAWSQARVQHCLPRLRRFLCSRPRRRVHQETMIRAWLEGRRLRQAPAADAAA